MYLACVSERATVGEVSRYFAISNHHVAKVVNQLSRLGFVRSIRGVGGGIELAKSPEEIRIGDVILAFEGNMHLLECVGVENICTIQTICKLKGVLVEAERMQVEYLRSVTLKDVLPAPQQLVQIQAFANLNANAE